MKKKVIIAAGGTGGHLYPAIGLAEQLSNKGIAELLFVAAGLESNPYFDRNKFLFKSISAGTFASKSIHAVMKTCKNIALGCYQSSKILAAFRPDLVVGFGSYHTFPLLLAARWKSCPIVLHEQNSKPGRVIRYFSNKALFTGAYFPSIKSALKGNIVDLAMPLREGYRKGNYSQELVEKYFQLDSSKMTVLIFGGSQGADFINHTASQALAMLHSKGASFQVLHFTGNPNAVGTLKKVYLRAGISAVVKPFEERMDLAWGLANLCIGRSGAGTIAELIEFEVPAILIPYPYAAENHQDANADYLVNEVGGGWKFHEHALDAHKLSTFCKDLLSQSSIKMREKIDRLRHHRNAACRKEFACVISNILGKG